MLLQGGMVQHHSCVFCLGMTELDFKLVMVALLSEFSQNVRDIHLRNVCKYYKNSCDTNSPSFAKFSE